jgi:hypothetical protein
LLVLALEPLMGRRRREEPHEPAGAGANQMTEAADLPSHRRWLVDRGERV